MTGPAIQTSARRYFDYTAPGLHPYSIREIAHSLSRICRYTGHVGDCDDPQDDDLIYTVAQHSVLVSDLLRRAGMPGAVQMQGLMHDASEAYTNDINSPLKSLLPDYRAIERRVEVSLRASFGLPWELDPTVKIADRLAMDCERMTFMGNAKEHHPRGWWAVSPAAQPLDVVWGIAESKRQFLARYQALRACPGADSACETTEVATLC